MSSLSVFCLGLMIMGGMGTIVGPIFSTMLFTLFWEIFSISGPYYSLRLGILGLLIVLSLQFYRAFYQWCVSQKSERGSGTAAL